MKSLMGNNYNSSKCGRGCVYVGSLLIGEAEEAY